MFDPDPIYGGIEGGSTESKTKPLPNPFDKNFDPMLYPFAPIEFGQPYHRRNYFLGEEEAEWDIRDRLMNTVGAFVDAESKANSVIIESLRRSEIVESNRPEASLIASRKEAVRVMFFNELGRYYLVSYANRILQLPPESYHYRVFDALNGMIKESPTTFAHSVVLMGMVMHSIKRIKFGDSENYVNDICLDCNELDIIAALLLHDIGKLHPEVHKAINSEENSVAVRNIARKHAEPIYVEAMFRRFGIDPLEAQLSFTAATTHHENDNGSGYPLHLSGRDIPILSEIIHILDVVEALSDNPLTNRKYNKVKKTVVAIWTDHIMHKETFGNYNRYFLREINRILRGIDRINPQRFTNGRISLKRFVR